MKILAATVLFAATLGGVLNAGGQSVRIVREFPLRGDLAHATDLSGVALWHDFVLACPDEGAELNIVQRDEGRLVGKVRLLADSDDEIDMEGAASDSQYVYVVGSHSMHRKQPDEQRPRRTRRRLPRARPHEASYSLFRLTLDDRGRLSARERISLKEILEADEALSAYTKIPGKENGVDIEGVAVKEGKLFVGFRGPVLRGNLVPIMSVAFDHPAAYSVDFVQLDGRGIRDLTAVEKGFLLLAGPVGEEDGELTLHFWDGAGASPMLLGDVRIGGDAKPEGIAVLSESDREWRVLLLCDGDSTVRELAVQNILPKR